MPAPEGNNNRMLWKTPEERVAACKRVCDHLASGLSKDCFPDADWQTINVYMRKYPVEFDANLIEDATRRGRLFWEQVGIDGTLGAIDGFNANSWKFNMQNRHGWGERQQLEHTGKDGGAIKTEQTITATNFNDMTLEAKNALAFILQKLKDDA